MRTSIFFSPYITTAKLDATSYRCLATSFAFSFKLNLGSKTQMPTDSLADPMGSCQTILGQHRHSRPGCWCWRSFHVLSSLKASGPGIKPTTSLLSGGSANHCASVSALWRSSFSKWILRIFIHIYCYLLIFMFLELKIHDPYFILLSRWMWPLSWVRILCAVDSLTMAVRSENTIGACSEGSEGSSRRPALADHRASWTSAVEVDPRFPIEP